MTQRHKHYDAIVAYAEGRQIQLRTHPADVWRDWEMDYCPGFCGDNEYRVKPATIKVWIALFQRTGASWTGTCNDASVARSWSLSKNFARWVMEGEEVEV